MLKIGDKAPEFSLPDQNGNIHVDPMFEVEHDGTNDLFNYALQEDSYCIDAGTTNFNQK